MKRKATIITLIALTLLFFLAGNTHRILPAEKDPCQTDLTHKDHVNELPMFHCIAHTEYEVNYEEKGLRRVKKWDHLHSWMTLEWHLQQGFTEDHATELIASAGQ